ncbi:hypothetical protein [Polymorphobacter fuscus]|nr:hypothetical protein [Polymorphobacter fuscus]
MRVIRMVSEMHRMGYQWARFMPNMHLSYRVWIAPAGAFSRINPAFIPGEAEPSIQYYSASENEYFHWTDAKNDTARQLAEKFIVRFPEISARCRGRDWAYAGWLAELLGVLEDEVGRLPLVMQDHMEPSGDQMEQLPLRSYWTAAGPTLGDRFFPLPPRFEREPGA